MIEALKRWYNGNTRVVEFESDPQNGIYVYPMLVTEHHWSATAVRAVVAFYLRHWQWLWGSAIVIALGVAAIIWQK